MGRSVSSDSKVLNDRNNISPAVPNFSRLKTPGSTPPSSFPTKDAMNVMSDGDRIRNEVVRGIGDQTTLLYNMIDSDEVWENEQGTWDKFSRAEWTGKQALETKQIQRGA
jgi:hypothetical protein